jgi:hypothetical protein
MNGNFSGMNNSNAGSGYWCGSPLYQQGTSPSPLPPPYTRKQTAPPAPGDMVTELPKTSFSPPTPTTLENASYMAGLLTTLVGEKVRVQFLIGTTGPMIDLVGTLVQVGANYIVIQPIESDDLTICDLYSIKFVTVLR